MVETRINGIKNPPELKDAELEICQLSKFGKKHQDCIKDKSLQNTKFLLLKMKKKIWLIMDI